MEGVTTGRSKRIHELFLYILAGFFLFVGILVIGYKRIGTHIIERIIGIVPFTVILIVTPYIIKQSFGYYRLLSVSVTADNTIACDTACHLLGNETIIDTGTDSIVEAGMIHPYTYGIDHRVNCEGIV